MSKNPKTQKAQKGMLRATYLNQVPTSKRASRPIAFQNNYKNNYIITIFWHARIFGFVFLEAKLEIET
jgi:hypothetical protein